LETVVCKQIALWGGKVEMFLRKPKYLFPCVFSTGVELVF